MELQTDRILGIAETWIKTKSKNLYTNLFILNSTSMRYFSSKMGLLRKKFIQDCKTFNHGKPLQVC